MMGRDWGKTYLIVLSSYHLKFKLHLIENQRPHSAPCLLGIPLEDNSILFSLFLYHKFWRWGAIHHRWGQTTESFFLLFSNIVNLRSFFGRGWALPPHRIHLWGGWTTEFFFPFFFMVNSDFSIDTLAPSPIRSAVRVEACIALLEVFFRFFFFQRWRDEVIPRPTCGRTLRFDRSPSLLLSHV